MGVVCGGRLERIRAWLFEVGVLSLSTYYTWLVELVWCGCEACADVSQVLSIVIGTAVAYCIHSEALLIDPETD